ncbi:ribbon-helix-helix protein, CopG family [Candidatus Bathyarchaeota archaeon]|nr:ribbon-helix-helix protein, CopG family [Candidatus Bathyarchaeota archaeon]
MSYERRTNRVTVVMSANLKSIIQTLADENERSVSDFIRLVLKEYVEALEGETQIVGEEEISE